MKKLSFYFFILIITFSTVSFAQNIAITDDNGYTADPSAMLDVKATNKGVLVPRLTSAQRVAVSSPATGLLVFDSDEGSFFFYSGTEWVDLSKQGQSWDTSNNKVFLTDSTKSVGIGMSTPTNKLTVRGSATGGVNESVFAVVSAGGDTLFAVYPEGTRIYVNDDAVKASGSKGGFAVGGFSAAKGTTNEYLRVTPDSVRVYIDENATAKAVGSRGGFAVGGFSSAKGANDSLLLFSDQNGLNVNYLTQAEIDAIIEPRVSSIVFNTTDSCLQIFLGYWESIWCTPLGCILPSVTTHPSDAVVMCPDLNTASFSVGASGSRLYYKWLESTDGGSTWSMIVDGGTAPEYSGAFTNTLDIINPPTSFNQYQYKCRVSNACGSEISDPATLATVDLGSTYGGGKVFYLSPTCDHGLIATTVNQGSNDWWGCDGTTTGATGTAIGTGSQNTSDITTACTTGGIAADICESLVHNGYSDWFLPSKDELNQLYLNKSFVGNMSTSYYWSSTEADAWSAYIQSFFNGNVTTDSKEDPAMNIYLRCIREF